MCSKKINFSSRTCSVSKQKHFHLDEFPKDKHLFANIFEGQHIQATGPLTQATGPLTQCGGGGNLYVEGEPRINRLFNVMYVEGEPRTNRLFNVR